MKKLLIIIALAFAGISTVQAQKKGSETETQVNVNYPIISVIYIEGEDSQGNNLGFADLQIHDRQGQTNDLDFHRMEAKSRDNDPVSPYAKVIFMEELGGYNFRLTENMEERSREPDGINTLLIHYSQFQNATRIKFPNQ